MNRLAAGALACAMLCGMTGVTPASNVGGDGSAVVARRGAVVLTEQSVRVMIEALPADSRDRLRQTPALLPGFVREKLLQAVLLEEAHERRWDARPEVIERAREARDAVIVDSYLDQVSAPDPGYPSDAEIAAAYDANKSRLMRPRRYHLAQIFIPVADASDARANAAAEKALQDAAGQVARGRADFGAEATALSKDIASAGRGGDLGWLDETALLPQMRTEVAGLQPGQVGAPLRAADGWHLIRVVETIPAGPAPLAETRPQIVQALRRQRQQALARAHVDALLKAEPGRIDEIGLERLVPKG